MGSKSRQTSSLREPLYPPETKGNGWGGKEEQRDRGKGIQVFSSIRPV